jgi:hypothetical protein
LPQIIGLKRLLFIVFFIASGIVAFAQNDTSVKPETTAAPKPKIIVPKKNIVVRDSVKKNVPDSSLAKKDSTIKLDSALLARALADSLHKDSVQKAVAYAAAHAKDTSTYASIITIPYLPFHESAVFMLTQEHEHHNKDELFYILVSAIAFFGFIKAIFPKYCENLFSIFFQTSFRQKQTRDQLLQNNWPSLLLNLLFVLSGGMYASLIIEQKEWVHLPFVMLLLYCAAILSIVYIIKYLFLRFSGWVFNSAEATNTYIFVVFISNKIVGVTLLPFLLILGFSNGKIVEVATVISIALLVIMLAYRYLVSLATIRSSLKVSGLHFFLYLCCIEILPLLIIYKVVFNYIATSI